MKVKVSAEKNAANDLIDRTFVFAVSVVNLLKMISRSTENDVIKSQLAKSATSGGANYEEAQGAYSKSDFSYKISICVREIQESNYWLRVMKATDIASGNSIDELIQESLELKKIFISIAKKIHYRKDFGKED